MSDTVQDVKPGFDFGALRARFAYQPVLLGMVALITSGLLAWVAQATQPAIEAAEARDLANSLAQVLPEGYADNDLLRDTLIIDDGGKAVVVHRARKAGEFRAAVFRRAAKGYAGDIHVLMAVAADGQLLGVRSIKHSETPGLGDKIEVEKGDWIHAFAGKSLADPPAAKWAVKKDGGIFDQFAGATITPRAVVKAVKEGLEFYAAQREVIAARPKAEGSGAPVAVGTGPEAEATTDAAAGKGPAGGASPAQVGAASPVKESGS